METRRLELLVELHRLGSMRAVADALGTTTSVVSQQLAALQAELGAALIERAGRGVRLTPAGARLALRGARILAELEAARRDFDPHAEPAGTLRVAGFGTAARALFPIIRELAVVHPAVRLLLAEQEPDEALALLADGAVDLALVYDYTLAPLRIPAAFDAVRLWTTEWGIAVPPTVAARIASDGRRLPARSVMQALQGHEWIGNSRNAADETVYSMLGAAADAPPRVTHQADDLSLVEDLIAADFGVGIVPLSRPARSDVALLRLEEPLLLRAFGAYRRGTADWPLLRHVLERLAPTAPSSPTG